MISAQRENDMKSLALLMGAQKLIDECEMLKKEGEGGTDKFKINMKDLENTYLQIKEIYLAGRQVRRPDR